MNRDLWKQSFSDTSFPAWPCPSCKLGVIQPVRDTVLSNASAESERLFEVEMNAPPEFDFGKYFVVLRCHRCRESVHLVGEYRINEDVDYSNGHQCLVYYTMVTPRYILCCPPVISLPKKLNENSRLRLNESFELLWSDESATANKIRVAIEDLLEQLENENELKGEKPANLHRRIEKLSASVSAYSEVCSNLLAIKWIGNAGSHGSEVNREDILDAYEILDDVFDELYHRKKDRVQNIVNEINLRKGPRSKM